MATLLVNDTTPRDQYTATGGQTAFTYSFAIFANTDLKVYLTPAGQTADDASDILTLTTDYTVSGAGSTSGGTVTLVVAATAGDIVTIVRDLPVSRTSDYQTAGDFLAETVNDDLDKLVMMVQQQEDKLDERIPSFGNTTNLTGVDTTIPAPEALKVVRWNAGATALENTDDPAVSAAAAAASEAAAAASAATAVAASNGTAYADGLTKLIHPDQSKGIAELPKQGVYPSSFNQQWGGVNWGGLPDGSLGEVAASCMHETGNSNIADTAARTYCGQGFKVSKTTTISSVWVKVYANGNPNSNLELYIYDDSSGDPSAVITNGTATAVDGNHITKSSEGEWVKFAFSTAPSVTANSQYHIVLKSSGAVSGSDYWNWMLTNRDIYPHGNRTTGDATPTWTADTSNAHLFLVEAGTAVMGSGLTNFDGALNFHQGTDEMLSCSGGFSSDNSYFNHKRGMLHFAGTGWDADKTFFDAGLALDHDRIVVRCNVTTGAAQVDLYESDGTKHTVTGTTNLTSGNHMVDVYYRAESDGSDALTLLVDGSSEGTPVSSATITLSPRFNYGHTTYGGGFGIAPTWTEDEDMSALPSAGSWSYAGTATEGNIFSVSGGVLYQNSGGYASTDNGRYTVTTTFSNSTGWVVATKIKVKNAGDATSDNSVSLEIYDGTKTISLRFHEFYLREANNSTVYQHDFTEETEVLITGKGANYYLFINSKLAIDGTGLLSAASASNKVEFGDIDTTAGENSDVEWHYIKYFEGEFLPEFSSLGLSEFAYWAKDQSTLLSYIYNSGTMLSVKGLAGLPNNYVAPMEHKLMLKGINSGPTTSSSSPVNLSGLNGFAFGEITASASMPGSNTSTSVSMRLGIKVDNTLIADTSAACTVANQEHNMAVNALAKPMKGLNFVEAAFSTDSGVLSAEGIRRNLTIRAN